jgi:hypothetical protein
MMNYIKCQVAERCSHTNIDIYTDTGGPTY